MDEKKVDTGESKEPKLLTHTATQPRSPILIKRPHVSVRWRRWLSIVAIIVLCGIAGFGGATIALKNNNTRTAIPALSSANDGNKITTTEEQSVAGVAQKVSPSVVSIVADSQSSSSSLFSSGTTASAGTGMILSADGYVMTNNHVTANSGTIHIITSDGKSHDDVTYIGRDPLNDIAFLKINNVSNLTPVTFGDSSTIKIGQRAVAIGNALGQYQNTVTSGIISGTGRPVTASDSSGDEAETLSDLIQTDAAINSGNSGGPLVNAAGQVIGINTAVAQDANGIGFAIPINSTKGVVAGLLQTGKIKRAYIGISAVDLTPEIAKQLNVSQTVGAYVSGGSSNGSATGVISGSPADKAGIKEHDIITKVGDKTVGQQGSLSTLIGEYRPDDTVQITLLRDGQTKTMTVTLAAYSNNSTND